MTLHDKGGIVISMTTTETTTPKMFTAPQRTLIDTLLDEREVTEELQAILTPMLLDMQTTKQASAIISVLFAQPRKDGQDATPRRYEPTEGCYQVGDTIYRVKISKSTGAWYAEECRVPVEGDGRVKLAWKYVGKRVRLSDEARMSDADAGRYLTYCVRCGAPLSDPESVERGMGATCAERVR